jgi:hypothetical protein
MNLRRYCLLGTCETCGCIRRIRPVTLEKWACTDCTEIGDGEGEIDQKLGSVSA